MIFGLSILLVYQLIGEVGVRVLNLSVPGPVLGMVLLFATLWLRGSVPEGLSVTSRNLLAQLSLLFVPAGVGVVSYLDLLASQGWALALTLVLSTLVTIAFTAFVLSGLLRLRPA